MIQILSNYGDLLLRAMGQTLLLALCGLLFGTLRLSDRIILRL